MGFYSGIKAHHNFNPAIERNIFLFDIDSGGECQLSRLQNEGETTGNPNPPDGRGARRRSTAIMQFTQRDAAMPHPLAVCCEICNNSVPPNDL
ncbi:hypothetical protein [Rhizobium sp. J15]|uniref:hypothetical protein n=1 Tax=Rhizobium sp. J15 TaxID=2035450 RepID=UPI001144EC86|nr:hypothetical protein [Rhizobium sp. J15]